jgi:peptidyl-prolyl cis-trans isomerase SurA
MPWFGTGRMIPEFEDVAFGLENKGDISKPFKSFYGWHIVKLLDQKPIGSYEDMKPELQEKANRGDRREYQTERYVTKLKEEYGFREYPEAYAKVVSAADTTLLKGTWAGGGLLEDDTPLMVIGDKTLSTGEFAAYMVKKQIRNKTKHVEPYVGDLYQDFVKDEVIAYEDSRLAIKYPEFRYIYQEYHDGILLFDIMDQRVWTKAVNDTLGLEAFHASHKNDYMWGERSDALLITCGEGADVEAVRKAHKKISKGRLDESALNASFCENDTIPCITVETLLVEKGDNELVDAMNGQTGLGPVVKEENTTRFVILRGMRAPEPKELDEARGQITSDYQNYLEQEWIRELKEKYPVDVDMTLLSEIER